MQMLSPSSSHKWIMVIPTSNTAGPDLTCSSSARSSIHIIITCGWFSFIPYAHYNFPCLYAVLVNTTLDVAVIHTNMSKITHI
ncbi:hypothetical protein LguiA_015236 [Lonicera macranthoides]